MSDRIPAAGSAAPDPDFLRLAAGWRDQLKDTTEAEWVEWIERLMDAHTPEGFAALVNSDLLIAGESAWGFMLTAAEFILVAHREAMRGVKP